MFRNRVLLVLATTVSTVILVIAVGAWPNVTGAPSATQSIVGSWSNAVTGLPGYEPGELNLLAFTSDGIVVGLYSSKIGAWARTGDHTVAATWFMNRYDAADHFIGTARVRATITLNATFDEYTASAARDAFDPEGTLIQTVGFSLKATRIHVEPLQR
jgi:hypothetical protein